MSDYIPPNPQLLTAAGATTPGSPRRMKIYFQPSPNPNDPNIVGANENDPPVAPAIDSNIDIAISNKKRYIQYAVDRSTNATANNPTPLNPDSTKQITYINQVSNLNYSGIPNAFNVFSNSPTMFENEILTRDAGVAQVDIINTEVGAIKGHYAGNVGRPFAIRKYVGQLNALETSDPDSDAQKNAHHNRLVDAQLLKFRGANSQNKRVPPAGGDPETRDNPITLGNMFYQGGLGKFASGSYVREDTSKATPLTVEQLKQVGLNIVFNAVGGNDIDANIKTPGDAAFAELALAAPIGPRIGQKVKLSRFSAAREAQKLFGATKSSSTTFIDTDDDVDSYGSFNNPFSQFDALVSVGQIAVTVAMVLAFVTILSGIVGLVSLSKDKTIRPGYNTDTFENDLVKGSYKLHGKDTKVYPTQVSDDLGDFLVSMMGVSNIFSEPKYNFDDCLSEGIREFFGFSPSGGSFATTSMKIMTESGRLNVILRELIRNGVDLGESAEAAFTGRGAASPIAGVVGFFKSLTDLKIIKFINVLVNIGDKALEGKADREIGGILPDGLFANNMGGVDSLPDNGYYIQKSRLSNGTLAWSTQTTPYFSLPLNGISSDLASNLSTLNLTPGNKPSTNWSKVGLTSEQEIDRSNEILRKGRISADLVSAFEGSLESDYMPFYFHDLRTNEIMSFHAFLENASEDFNVEYTSQEGYGRMDKVQIYKGTTRNITVDFKMIATNAESHDDMWYKINRLAMMIYPQWTQGRKLDVGDLKFIQPFSQIPGATPVIRLRLGDLYKSNYSKMAVARLFGATTRQDYTVVGSTTPTAAATPATPTATSDMTFTPEEAAREDVEGRVAILNRVINDHGDFTSGQTTNRTRRHSARINPNTVFIPNTSVVVLDMSKRGVMGLLRSSTINSPIRQQVLQEISNNPDRAKIRCTFLGVTRDSVRLQLTDLILLTPPLYSTAGSLTGGTVLQRGATEERFSVQTNDNRPLTIRIRDLRSMMDLTLTSTALQAELQRTTAPTANTGNTDEQMNTSNFYDDNKNPILKAFNSTAGKGLAGVITSFKVDYKESDKRWGTDVGTTLRAPMYVTISVTMAVIHDIPLGLDANGIMNAPIWPVGNSSNYFMRGERPATATAPPGPNTVASSPQAVDSEVAGAPRGLG
jgi:hypothetical protein